MNKKNMKRTITEPRKHWKQTGQTVCCLLLISSLLFGGCSAPAAPKKDTNSQKTNVAEIQEDTKTSKDAEDSKTTEETEKDSQEPQDSSKDSDSSTEDFDFNQSLALKIPEPAAGENPRILFVGNSHTYSNDLPGIFSQLAAAMGHECDVQELSEGSYTLTQFADSTDELGAVLNQKLTQESWDFVMIQENTNDAFSYAEENMLPAATVLDEKIHAAGGQTALLMTWTPKDGASVMSREYVQSILAQNLIHISNELGSLLIPGGVAFMRCLDQYPQIELWAEDGMHPSLEGSYLAACAAYAVIFQESPAGCTYTADIDSEIATQLQTLAGEFLVK